MEPSARPAPATRRAITWLLSLMNYLTVAGSAAGAAAAVLSAEGPPRGPLALFGWSLVWLAPIYLVAWSGLWRLRRYGRGVQLALAWVGTLAFPLGTAIAIALLVHLNRPDTRRLLSGGGGAPDVAGPKPPAATAAVHPAMLVAVVILLAATVAGLFVAGPVGASSGALQSLLQAIDHHKQDRTIGDLRSIAIALESYYSHNDAYPDAASLEELARQLEPLHIRTLPRTDGWERLYRYQVWGRSADHGPADYALASAGRDGVWEHEDLRDYAPSATRSFECDIVYQNGLFTQYPEGIQT